jgi:hypothetical protein
MKCPCCGQEMSEEMPIDALNEVCLSVMERSVVRVLRESYPRGRTTRALIEAIYPYGNDVEDEGALIRQFVCRARKKLRPFGWDIPPSPPHRGVYRLEKIQ